MHRGLVVLVKSAYKSHRAAQGFRAGGRFQEYKLSRGCWRACSLPHAACLFHPSSRPFTPRRHTSQPWACTWQSHTSPSPRALPSAPLPFPRNPNPFPHFSTPPHPSSRPRPAAGGRAGPQPPEQAERADGWKLGTSLASPAAVCVLGPLPPTTVADGELGPVPPVGAPERANRVSYYGLTSTAAASVAAAAGTPRGTADSKAGGGAAGGAAAGDGSSRWGSHPGRARGRGGDVARAVPLERGRARPGYWVGRHACIRHVLEQVGKGGTREEVAMPQGRGDG